jgi:pyruvate dehydrogenase E2 component (dihydrolipoamide acetyltransferase)
MNELAASPGGRGAGGEREEHMMGEEQPGQDGRQKLSKMRRAIVASMNLSAQIPQFTLDRSVDLTRASALRDEIREAGAAVSWEDLLVASAARALREHPEVNASFDEDAIVQHPEIHVGIATALADGLVSPAITNTDQRSLEELVSERKRLRAGAAEGKLRGVELFGATFTISNLGPFGIDRFRALVIPPQAAILAAGRVAEHGGRLTQSLTLSADHRVLDGAPGAQFLTTICGLLETPEWLMELAPAGIAAGTA